MINILIFIGGLIIGSFLNMLIYRLPLGISLLNPKRSFCPNCNTQIKWYENIPVISYCILKGKCSHCKEKISIIYPIVEIISAIVTFLIFYKNGFNYGFIITALLFYILITLSFIDFKYKAVPDYLLITALLLALNAPHLTLSTTLQNAMLFAGAFALLELFITFYIQNIKAKITKNEDLKNQKALGEGDIPIAAAIGALLGIKLGIAAIFLGAIFAIIPSIYNIVRHKNIETPFIPYLSLGLFVTYILESKLLSLLGYS